MATIFDKAHVTLPSEREVRVARSFKAPRALVWRAHTEPALIQQWMLGPPGWSMPVCEMDLREGGAYRWRWRNDEDGKEFGFYGTFREIAPQARIVHEEHYDPGDIGGAMPTDGPAIITAEFSEEGGVTTLTSTMRFPTQRARDDAMSTGMTDGMEMGYERLEKILAERV